MSEPHSCRKLWRCRKTGKRTHPNFVSAAHALKKYAKDHHESVNALNCYWCNFCDGWHVGHDNRVGEKAL